MNLDKLYETGRWMLRTSDDGVSYGGFRRKRIGAWNKAEKWTGKPSCNTCDGFFGIDKEANEFGLLWNRNTIELCEWRGERVVIGDDKSCVSEFRVVAINSDIPDKFFEACNIKVAHDGDVVSPGYREQWVALEGHCKVINQSGGVFWALDNTHQTVSGQRGGEFLAHGRSEQTVSGQTDGEFCAHGRSTQKVYGQTGGAFCAHDHSSQKVSGQSGGVFWAGDRSSQTVSGQTGGEFRAYDHSKQKVSGQTGGEFRAYDHSKQKVSGQRGGGFLAYDNSKQVWKGEK